MYIDAKKIGKHIYVSDRNEQGERFTHRHLPNYVMYYPDNDGEYTGIDGVKLTRYETHNYFDFRDAISNIRDESGLPLYESDINPVYRLLEERYPGDDGPTLNVTIFDIEVDKDQTKGFSSVSNPYAPITAISLHNKWSDEYITLVVPPENLTEQECRDLLDGKIFQDSEGNLIDECPEDDTFGIMSEDNGFFIVPDEETVLRLFLELIYDADVLSGWNSTFFDIPYIIQRMRMVLGGESISKVSMEDGSDDKKFSPTEDSQEWINQLNLFPCSPTMRMVEHFGTFEKTYNLHGRIHLDYLELYRKFTYEELHSYALDAVLKKEIDQQKVAYDGSLDQLYRKNFRRFAAYAHQDTKGLSLIDDKKKLINLANSMAHLAGVTLDKVLGSVTLIEQAILKELHRTKKMICFDKVEKDRDYPIPGAFVLEPQMGVYKWIASYDFNSLYPTVIRMLNISPETIIGWVNPKTTLEQLHHLMVVDGMEGAEAWSHFPGTIEYNMVVERSSDMVEFFLEGGDDPITVSGAELNDIIQENNWVITAFGLVLHRDFQGIIPYCLEKWYDQRTSYKKKAKAAWQKSEKCETEDEKKKAKDEYAYWDMLQLVQKIFLNSTYGALLNAFCRFYDPRMGASVTMSGRICLSTMVDHIEEIMTHEVFHKNE